MDMDLGAGGDSARRKMDLTGEVTEVVPLEMYDSARAKIAANLRWLFAKAYGIGKSTIIFLTGIDCRHICATIYHQCLSPDGVS